MTLNQHETTPVVGKSRDRYCWMRRKLSTETGVEARMIPDVVLLLLHLTLEAYTCIYVVIYGILWLGFINTKFAEKLQNNIKLTILSYSLYTSIF